MKRADVENRVILLAVVGSHAYGTNTPSSDLDIKGVCIAPEEYQLGFKSFEQKDSGWEDTNDPPSGKFPILEGIKDCCIYELRKFLQLAANNNPTLLEMLWLKEYEFLSPLGKEVLRYRKEFLSTKVKHTYSGYAYAQLRKVETHRRWLLNPPTKKPEAKDFGVGDNQEPLTKEQMGSFLEFLYMVVRDRIEFMEPTAELRKLLLEDIDYRGLFKQRPIPVDCLDAVQELTRASKDYIKLLQTSQSYRKALDEWKSYQDWKSKRNPERATLEAKCGYDCKHAMHSIRLLRQGIECMRTGRLIVNRRDAGDAEELIAIRNGEYHYDTVKAMADKLFAELEASYTNSVLPRSVNLEFINELCCKWIKDYLT